MRPAKKEKSYFSKRLIELRTTRGLTQEQLAEGLAVSIGTVSYYESKAKNPKIESLNTLASFFDVPIDSFFENGRKSNSKRGPSSKLELKVEQIKKLSNSKQKLANDMLDMIIQGSQTT